MFLKPAAILHEYADISSLVPRLADIGRVAHGFIAAIRKPSDKSDWLVIFFVVVPEPAPVPDLILRLLFQVRAIEMRDVILATDAIREEIPVAQ